VLEVRAGLKICHFVETIGSVGVRDTRQP
jgi:hypothetical protein